MPATHSTKLCLRTASRRCSRKPPISENIPYPYRLSDSMTFGGHESNNTHDGVRKTPCPIKESGVFSK